MLIGYKSIGREVRVEMLLNITYILCKSYICLTNILCKNTILTKISAFCASFRCSLCINYLFVLYVIKETFDISASLIY